MNLDMNNLRDQLAPGWSTVNIVLLVVLFFLFWPLALLMIAYILGGGAIGLDLGRPDTFARAWARLQTAFVAGRHALRNTTASEPLPSAQTNFERWRDEEITRLRLEREQLESDKAAFESQKRKSVEQTDSA